MTIRAYRWGVEVWEFGDGDADGRVSFPKPEPSKRTKARDRRRTA